MEEDDDFVKVCVTLSNKQVVWLDRANIEIRGKTMKHVGRSELIRRFIDEGIERSGKASDEEFDKLLEEFLIEQAPLLKRLAQR